MDDSTNNRIKKIVTPIGKFTINSYEIPAGYTLYSSPAIVSDSDDTYKIITIDQLIQIRADKYTPVLHQNCMIPEEKTIYPLTIIHCHDDKIILKDHYHSLTLDLHKLPDIQIHPWYPLLKKKSCIPCTNCGRCCW